MYTSIAIANKNDFNEERSTNQGDGSNKKRTFEKNIARADSKKVLGKVVQNSLYRGGEF